MRDLRGLLLGALLLLSVAPVHADPAEDTAAMVRERAAAHGVSGAWLEAVGRCESSLNVSAHGAAGEIGLFQLWPSGLLPLFYAWGYSDPWNGWEQADFTARAFAAGLHRQWSCAR